jgi:hypothetical protein
MATYNFETGRYETSPSEELENTGRGAVEQVKEKAGEIAQRAQEQAKSTLNSQKTNAAQDLGTVAEVFRETGQQLREREHYAMADTVAQYTEKLADQVDHFSQQLRNKDIEELIYDVGNMARRQPALFLGGAFAAGILVARFLKSSSRRQEEIRTGQAYYDADRPMLRRQAEFSDYRSTTSGTGPNTSMYGEERLQETETSQERNVGKEGLEYDL